MSGGEDKVLWGGVGLIIGLVLALVFGPSPKESRFKLSAAYDRCIEEVLDSPQARENAVTNIHRCLAEEEEIQAERPAPR